MKAIARSMDIILDTIGAENSIEPYLDLLKKNGTFVFTLKGCLPEFVIFGDGLPSPAYNVVSKPLQVKNCIIRGKFLLESWGTTFLPDRHPPLIFVQFT